MCATYEPPRAADKFLLDPAADLASFASPAATMLRAAGPCAVRAVDLAIGHRNSSHAGSWSAAHAFASSRIPVRTSFVPCWPVSKLIPSP